MVSLLISQNLEVFNLNCDVALRSSSSPLAQAQRAPSPYGAPNSEMSRRSTAYLELYCFSISNNNFPPEHIAEDTTPRALNTLRSQSHLQRTNDKKQLMTCTANEQSTLMDTIIKLIAGRRPRHPTTQGLEMDRTNRHPGAPKPSQVIGEIRTRNQRVFSPLCDEPHSSALTMPTNHSNHHHNLRERAIQMTQWLSPPKREPPLRIGLLKYRASRSGMPMPRPAVEWSSDSESDSEDDEWGLQFEAEVQRLRAEKLAVERSKLATKKAVGQMRLDMATRKAGKKIASHLPEDVEGGDVKGDSKAQKRGTTKKKTVVKRRSPSAAVGPSKSKSESESEDGDDEEERRNHLEGGWNEYD